MEYLSSLYQDYLHDSSLKAVQKLREIFVSVVPGSGSRIPRAIFIGMNPTPIEHRNRRPLSGNPGDAFETMINNAGMMRSDIFITYVVKFCTQGNRDASAQEIEESLPYLRREIKIVGQGGCRTIVTMGNSVFQLLSGQKDVQRKTQIGGWTIFNLPDPRVNPRDANLQIRLNEIGSYVNSLVE